MEAHGHCDARFSPLADVFLEAFEPGGEVGAALAVTLDGQAVVDLHAGVGDPGDGSPWREDTLCCVFSATKGMATLAVLQAVAAGQLDLDTPIAAYWPAFAAHGKAGIPVRQLLNHQSGLVGFHEPFDRDRFYDAAAVCERLADEAPWWTPGQRHGYHARTFGFLLDEVMRRATGESIAERFRREVAVPLALDFHIGLEPADEARCARMLPARLRPGDDVNFAASTRAMMKAMMERGTTTHAAFANPSLGRNYMNSDAFRRAAMPAMNGHGTARSLARVYGGLAAGGVVDGVKLLDESLIAAASTVESFGADEVLKGVMKFGLGFTLGHDDMPLGPNPRAFGHPGAGGSLAFSDPDADLGFAYVMNQMQAGVVAGGRRARTLVEACYACL